jgi:hypothetical protein
MIDSFEAFSVLLLILPGILGFFVYNQVSDFKVKDTLPSVSWVIFFLISTQITSIGLFGQSFFPDLGAETQSGAHQKITAYLGDISATPLIVAAGYGAPVRVLEKLLRQPPHPQNLEILQADQQPAALE